MKKILVLNVAGVVAMFISGYLGALSDCHQTSGVLALALAAFAIFASSFSLTILFKNSEKIKNDGLSIQ